jgi:arylsulfatase A
LKLADNTILIFLGDNGHLGPKDSKPLRGSKADLYEGGIRVPMIVRWPGVVTPASLCREPVISIDLFTTFLDAAGLKPTDPTVDGVSLMPLLKQTGSLGRDAIYFHYPHYHGQSIAPSGVIRQGKYKLVEWFEKSVDGFSPAAVELYDLENDLNEQNNLAEKMPQKAAELYTKLKNWRKSVGAQEMIKNPNYSG